MGRKGLRNLSRLLNETPARLCNVIGSGNIFFGLNFLCNYVILPSLAPPPPQNYIIASRKLYYIITKIVIDPEKNYIK
jgi:hypothetical protein